jgi:hypothetical protein
MAAILSESGPDSPVSENNQNNSRRPVFRQSFHKVFPGKYGKKKQQGNRPSGGNMEKKDAGTGRKRVRLTPVSIFHYYRLIYRSLLLIAVLVLYIRCRIHSGGSLTDLLESQPVMMGILWIVFTVEMILRFFPSGLESPGSQKQFARNYMRSGGTDIVIHDNNATMLVGLIWICFNAVFWILYLSGIFDDGIMLLISCAYSVCDMICILFFCPFQSWFFKSKCCTTCRIYNWDFAMIFTPLLFVRGIYARSLLAMSLILFFRWEITFYLHPERFSEKTNQYLQCKNCTEKLCSHKKQLHSLWKDIEQHTSERMRRLRGGDEE